MPRRAGRRCSRAAGAKARWRRARRWRGRSVGPRGPPSKSPRARAEHHHGRQLREESAARPQERRRLEAEEVRLGGVRTEQRRAQRDARGGHGRRTEPAAADVEGERQQRQQHQGDPLEHGVQRNVAAEQPVGEHHDEVGQVLVVAQHRESLAPVADPGVEGMAAGLPGGVHALDKSEVEDVVVDVRRRHEHFGQVSHRVEQARRRDQQHGHGAGEPRGLGRRLAGAHARSLRSLGSRDDGTAPDASATGGAARAAVAGRCPLR
jgi:hypothetical protein